MPPNGRRFVAGAGTGVTNVVGGGNQARGTARSRSSPQAFTEDANVFTLTARSTPIPIPSFRCEPESGRDPGVQVNTNSYSAELGYNSGRRSA